MSRKPISLKHISILILPVFLLAVSATACWGSAAFDIIVENQTSQTLKVYVNDYYIGVADTEEQIIKEDEIWDDDEYEIEAEDMQGNSVFSEIFSRDMMEKVDRRLYKVIITSDNITK